MYDDRLSLLFEEPRKSWGLSFRHGAWEQGWPPEDSGATRRHGWHWTPPQEKQTVCGIHGKQTFEWPYPEAELNTGNLWIPIRLRDPTFCDVCHAAYQARYGNTPEHLALHDEIDLVTGGTRSHWHIQGDLERVSGIYIRIDDVTPRIDYLVRRMREILNLYGEDTFSKQDDRKRSYREYGHRLGPIKPGPEYRNLWAILKSRVEGRE